mmetsp:Transcript_398/g.681  ORF Transcript_398/g.681 Transcript_398/m.681 type:complete len:201 (+) Transcript_398:2126-2728(+)
MVPLQRGRHPRQPRALLVVAVKPKAGVAGMVHPLVVGHQLRQAQLRQLHWHAAAFILVGCVGEEGAREELVQAGVGVGEDAAHLTQHDAPHLHRLRLLCVLQRIVPRLLLEDVRLAGHQRSKQRVQVDVYQVVQVLQVGGGDREEGAVCKGFCVQVGVNAALGHTVEGRRRVGGVLLRATQQAVLQHVRHPFVILHRRAK